MNKQLTCLANKLARPFAFVLTSQHPILKAGDKLLKKLEESSIFGGELGDEPVVLPEVIAGSEGVMTSSGYLPISRVSDTSLQVSDEVESATSAPAESAERVEVQPIIATSEVEQSVENLLEFNRNNKSRPGRVVGKILAGITVGGGAGIGIMGLIQDELVGSWLVAIGVSSHPWIATGIYLGITACLGVGGIFGVTRIIKNFLEQRIVEKLHDSIKGHESEFEKYLSSLDETERDDIKITLDRFETKQLAKSVRITLADSFKTRLIVPQKIEAKRLKIETMIYSLLNLTKALSQHGWLRQLDFGRFIDSKTEMSDETRNQIMGALADLGLINDQGEVQEKVSQFKMLEFVKAFRARLPLDSPITNKQIRFIYELVKNNEVYAAFDGETVALMISSGFLVILGGVSTPMGIVAGLTGSIGFGAVSGAAGLLLLGIGLIGLASLRGQLRSRLKKLLKNEESAGYARDYVATLPATSREKLLQLLPEIKALLESGPIAPSASPVVTRKIANTTQKLIKHLRGTKIRNILVGSSVGFLGAILHTLAALPLGPWPIFYPLVFTIWPLACALLLLRHGAIQRKNLLLSYQKLFADPELENALFEHIRSLPPADQELIFKPLPLIEKILAVKEAPAPTTPPSPAPIPPAEVQITPGERMELKAAVEALIREQAALTTKLKAERERADALQVQLKPQPQPPAVQAAEPVPEDDEANITALLERPDDPEAMKKLAKLLAKDR